MRGPIVARQEGRSQAQGAGSAGLLKLHQNVSQESSRGVYDWRHMSSAPRASPVVFRPHRWQGCRGQVCPGHLHSLAQSLIDLTTACEGLHRWGTAWMVAAARQRPPGDVH